MRELRIGEDVLGREGERVGKLERIVVDESGDRVTHLVVDDRVIELTHFRDAGPDGLLIDCDTTELQQFPRLEESEFAAPGEHWEAPPGFVMRNFLALAALVGQAPYQPPVQADLTSEERAHEITAGSQVWSGDTKLGEVDEVFTDDGGRTTQLGVRLEGIAAHHVLVSVDRVREVVGNNVHVDVGEDEVERLERYTRAPKRTS